MGRKGFLTIWFEVDREPVILVNTHLLANYDEDWSPSNRYAVQQLDELDQLAEAAGKLEKEALLLVAGDFNVPAANPMLAAFLSRTGLRHTAGPAAATYRSINPESPDQQIDHILFRPPPGGSVNVSTKLHFEDAVTVAGGHTLFASDHFGVEAAIEYEPPSRPGTS